MNTRRLKIPFLISPLSRQWGLEQPSQGQGLRWAGPGTWGGGGAFRAFRDTDSGGNNGGSRSGSGGRASVPDVPGLPPSERSSGRPLGLKEHVETFHALELKLLTTHG